MSDFDIDLTYIKDACGNDEASLKELINLFVKETPRNIDSIQDSLNIQDWNNVKSISHKLKSSFKIFGLTELSDKFALIERNALTEAEQSNVVETFAEAKKSTIEVIDHLTSNYLE